MHALTIAEQWQSIQSQLKSCDDLLIKLHEQDEFFIKFNNWHDVIKRFRRVKRGNPESDKILKPILGSIQKDNDPRWNIVVTALLWNALGSIFGKKKSYDEEHLDDLWQNINWVFIETVRSLDLNRFTEKYAYLIYLKTQNALYAKYQSPRKIDRYEFPVKPQILDYVLPFEDLSLNKLEHINPVDDGKDPDVESGNISIRTYLKAVKVADTEFENITSPINLDWLLRHGVISHSEHYLLERTLRYEESMAECAEYLGLSYEAAKKQRQRALKKIKENENSVSP